MAGIYQADIWCDDCADAIGRWVATDIMAEGPGAVLPDGTDYTGEEGFDGLL